MKNKLLKYSVPILALAAIITSCVIIAANASHYTGDEEYTLSDKLRLKLVLYSPGKHHYESRIIGLHNGDKVKVQSFETGGTCYTAVIYPDKIDIYLNGKNVSEYKSGYGTKILDSFISDFNNDKNDELFIITKNSREQYGDRLIILGYINGKLSAVFDQSYKKVNPWKVQVCDVDGDGEKEIALGVYTKAEYHPVFAKRLFIYYYHDCKLYPKWLGSRLSRPFDDYTFYDIDYDGMDEVISIEYCKDQKKQLNSYKWKGFGFESAGVSREYDDILDLKTNDKGVAANVVINGEKFIKTFKYNDFMIEW